MKQIRIVGSEVSLNREEQMRIAVTGAGGTGAPYGASPEPG
jgi:hypothetical protein